MPHRLSCSSCGILPDQRLKSFPLHWQADSLSLTHQRSPKTDSLNGQIDIIGDFLTHLSQLSREQFHNKELTEGINYLTNSVEHHGLPRWLSGKEPTFQYRSHGFDP